VTVAIDRTAPAVSVTGLTGGASYPLGSLPAAGCSTSDALSGVATQASLSISGGNADGSGSFTATCSGATDLAGNAASASVTYTVKGATFPATAVLDNFNHANGKIGTSWDGLTGTEFYKIAGNKLDVQLGGPLVWKASSFGTTQEAFVRLSTIDPKSPSQGLLLKMQTGNVPNAAAISVVYDAKAKAVRVSALRLERNGVWTPYPNQAATFANGDVLGARAKADGTVEIYKNGTLVATVTLNAADQAFFNPKGGKIGIWTMAASSAVLDDFGGGNAAP
jgi:beta-glucosidase